MRHLNISPTYSAIPARRMSADGHSVSLDKSKLTEQAVNALRKIGINIDRNIVHKQIDSLISDYAKVGDAAFTAPISTPSVPTPIQFLQTWLPGFVKVLTSARKIDMVLGIKTVGSWEDQEIVQGFVEPSATPSEYGDYSNIPLSSWNTNYERRTVVRGLIGMQVSILEEKRAAAMRLSSSEEKRQASAISLEIMRNAIGFYGWNNGDNRTFGLLNDPNLLPFITTSVTDGWAKGTFQQITGDIRSAVVQLRTQSQDQIDPERVDMTLALPTSHVDYLTETTDYGVSVRDWLTKTYPRIRVVSVPEFNSYSGTNPAGEAVMYLFAEEIASDIDGSSDGGEVFAQLVQSKFMTLGVEKRVQNYVEGYSNASAGVICKRPWAVVRVMGI